MEFKVVTVTALWLALLSLTLNHASATPQRALNTLSHPQQSKDKLSTGEDPKQAKIMKQISKVNEDGSYTFGYEADDGSFRVETRSKDGVVKGRYGYVDEKGELKVMEYTAGEKTGSPEEYSEQELPTGASDQVQKSRPLSERPLPLQYLSRQSKSSPVALPLSRSDQASSAQTSSGNVSSPPSSGDEDEERDAGKGEQEDDDDDEGQKDVNNGQYFRAVPQQGSGQGPSAPPPGLGSEGPRYVPSHGVGLGRGPGLHQQIQPHPQYNFAPQQGFSTLPQQYAGPSQGQGSRGSPYPPQYQGFPQGNPQGFGGPQSSQGLYSPQSQLGQSSPLSGQSLPSPYGGQYDDDDDFTQNSPQQGPSPGSRYPSQFGQQAGPGRSPPNVQVQYRGSSPGEELGRQEAPQYFGQQQGFSPQQQYQGFAPGSRQFDGRGQGGSGSDSDRYVPNIDLDGFSEDADEDGYVDDPPKGGSAAAQEKQGVAVKALGGGRGQAPGEAYRPQVLGPQGVLQGGQVQLGNGREQPYQPGRSPFQGPSGLEGQGPSGLGGQGQYPQLSEEQIQQLFAQQGGFSPQGGQGQFLGGGGRPQYPGFPGQGQFQGFPLQGQGQSPFIGQSGGAGPRPQSQSRPIPQGFQQNPQVQGQYVPTSQQGGGVGQSQGSDSGEFTGFPPQFGGQSQGGPNLPPQYFNQRPISQQGQFQPPSQGFSQGQGFPGVTGQGQGQGQAGSGQGGPGQGSLLQSSGFPYDFNPFGNQGGFQQIPQQQFQGFPQQGPGGFGQGQPGFPQYTQGAGGQGQGGFQGQGGSQGLSQQQIAAILQSQQGGGPPLPPGFSSQPQIQGFVPGRFPNNGQYLGGGAGGSSLGGQGGFQGQGSSQLTPSPSGASIQLGGGAPRPVQPAASSSPPVTSGGGLFGGEERKSLTSSASSSSSTKSTSGPKAN